MFGPLLRKLSSWFNCRKQPPLLVATVWLVAYGTLDCIISIKQLFINLYLLLAEFSVRTVNYGLSFFHRFMAQERSAQAINRWKKTRICNLQ